MIFSRTKFTLYPFRTDVLKEILSEHSPNCGNEDLLCLYMITGGVAKYVELLMDAQCYTKDRMIDYVCRQDSYFLTEGRDMVNQEFGEDGVTYFSILQMIADGMTRRGDIDLREWISTEYCHGGDSLSKLQFFAIFAGVEAKAICVTKNFAINN